MKDARAVVKKAGRAILAAEDEMAKKKLGRPTEPIEGKKFSGEFVLRITPQRHEEIAHLAVAEHRSLNGQIAQLIDEALEARKRPLP